MNTEYMYTESYIISKDNLEINLDKWGPGTPLWITGTSGDGKSTLAQEMANKHDSIIISTDYVLIRLTKIKEKAEKILARNTDSNQMEPDGLSISIEFIEEHPEMPYGIGLGPGGEVIQSKYFKLFFKFIQEKAKQDPALKTKYIIVEGCAISFMDIEIAVTQPLIILGCSRLKAFIRRYKRERSTHDDGIHTKQELSALETIWMLIKKYKQYGKDLDDTKENFRKEIETHMKKTGKWRL